MRGTFSAILRTPFAGPWRRFSDPERVLLARTPAEVRPLLSEVNEAVRGGLYAAGFVSYEAAAAFGLPVHAPAPGSLPLAGFGLFRAESVETLTKFPVEGVADLGAWQPTMSHDEYLEAIARIKERIAAGDTYQINLTFRLRAPFRGDARRLMADLYAAQAGPWSAFVEAGDHTICSASPELFYIRNAERIECHPMKGTAARGWWPAQDVARGEELQRSEKNRAENVMIVDMVRNDLGRVAHTGSVQANPLFAVARYPLQWQMTSRVTAEVHEATLGGLFEAMFPSGSVTGAPKHSAMRIIQSLESTPRGVYTGAIGYISPHARSHFSVAIRTVVVDHRKGEAEFGVGSGVVWDSVDRDEYEECLIKAAMVTGAGFPVPGSRFPGSPMSEERRANSGEPFDSLRSLRAGSFDSLRSLRAGAERRAIPAYVIGERPGFQLLETIGWTPGDGFTLLDRHLERMCASAACFGFPCDALDLRTVLEAAVADLHKPARVRLLLEPDGTVACEALDLVALPEGPLRAALAPTPIDRGNLFLYHKTTRREVYEAAKAGRPAADAVILWNADGEVTEATDYNVVVEIDGVKVTPPVECGLLSGVMRADLLARGEIVERRIMVDELRALDSLRSLRGGATRIWLINSVRGWVEATVADR